MSNETHDELLAKVGWALGGVESPPPDVVRQARAAFAWREISAGLAALDYDSAVDGDDLARVRGAADRRLSFRAPTGAVELSIIDGGTRLIGQVSPVGTGEVQLRHPSGTQSTVTDRFGQFIFDSIGHGPLSIRWQPEGASEGFDTEWVTI